MQTWVTEEDYRISAMSLDRQRLGAQIYEGIHILSSLLCINSLLVTPKRSVVNHPIAKYWEGKERLLLMYIKAHLYEWMSRGYNTEINLLNIGIIERYLGNSEDKVYPIHFDKDIIKVHREKLIAKNPAHYSSKWN